MQQQVITSTPSCRTLAQRRLVGLRVVGLLLAAAQALLSLARHAEALRDVCSYADAPGSFLRAVDTLRSILELCSQYVLVVNVRL
jgi:hypothetical protein